MIAWVYLLLAIGASGNRAVGGAQQRLRQRMTRHADRRRDQGDQLGHDFGVGGRAAQAHGVHQQAKFGAGHHPGNRLEGKLQAHPQFVARQVRQRQGEGLEEALEHRLVVFLEVFLNEG
mgnify:CR=1 FL=1